MSIPRWSLADLKQQRLKVRAIAFRAEADRRKVAVARRAFTARIRRALASPAVLGGAFVAGFLVLQPGTRRRGGKAVAGLGARVRNVTASIVWLTQLYRQFHSGIAVGSAIAARSRSAARAPTGPPP